MRSKPEVRGLRVASNQGRGYLTGLKINRDPDSSSVQGWGAGEVRVQVSRRLPPLGSGSLPLTSRAHGLGSGVRPRPRARDREASTSTPRLEGEPPGPARATADTRDHLSGNSEVKVRSRRQDHGQPPRGRELPAGPACSPEPRRPAPAAACSPGPPPAPLPAARGASPGTPPTGPQLSRSAGIG